jgi:hypothetical protein
MAGRIPRTALLVSAAVAIVGAVDVASHRLDTQDLVMVAFAALPIVAFGLIGLNPKRVSPLL